MISSATNPWRCSNDENVSPTTTNASDRFPFIFVGPAWVTASTTISWQPLLTHLAARIRQFWARPNLISTCSTNWPWTLVLTTLAIPPTNDPTINLANGTHIALTMPATT